MTSDSALVYVGTYTVGTGSEGIYIYRLDYTTGTLTLVNTLSGLTNPSFVAVDPQHKYLYAVQELAQQGNLPSGAVSAFAINSATGDLSEINRESSHGVGPCYVSVDHTGKWVLVANYNSGSVCALPVQENGALGPATGFVQHHGHGINPSRQEGPHAHSIMPDPVNHFMLANDLGLDKIFVYQLDLEQGTLSEGERLGGQLRPGAGPRHLAFHPNNTWLYCINELDSTITAFIYDAEQGSMQAFQTISTIPDDFTEAGWCAHILVEPNGRYLYGSNRGHNSIAIFEIDATSGQLEARGYVTENISKPRHFNVDPSGQFMIIANQDSGTLISYRINHATGALNAVGQSVAIPAPVCVCIVA